MSNFDESLLKRLTRLEREVERLRVKEKPDMSNYLGVTAKAADSDKLDGFHKSEILGSPSSIAANLNNCLTAGAYAFSSSTLNIPVANSYGVVFALVAPGETHNNENNWIWQLAFTTLDATHMYLRNKTNDGSWTSWSTYAAV